MRFRFLVPLLFVLALLVCGVIFLVRSRGDHPKDSSQPASSASASDSKVALPLEATPVVVRSDAPKPPARPETAEENAPPEPRFAREDSPPTGTKIDGRVLDDRGDPVVGAALAVQSDGRPFGAGRAKTSSTGEFVVQGMSAGKTRFNVFAKDFVRADVDLGFLGEGAERHDVRVVLSRLLPITGRVEWPDGKPAPKCFVGYCRHKSDPGMEGMTVEEVACDENGAFKIDDPGNSATALIARSPARADRRDAAASREVWVAFATSVMPGTSGLLLVLRQGSNVTARLEDASGAPIANGSVDAHVRRLDESDGDDYDNVRGLRGEKEGEFRIQGLHDGEWDLVAFAPGFARSDPIRIVAPNPENVIDIVLQRTATLSGTVVDEANQPVEGVLVMVGILEEESGKAFSAHFTGREKLSDSQGRFEIDDVVPGRVIVEAHSQGGLPSADGELRLDVTPGEILPGLKLTLRPQSPIRGGR